MRISSRACSRVTIHAKFKFFVLLFNSKMSSSMSLEERFGAPVTSYQTVSSSNNELKQRLDEAKGQNAYLRKQRLDCLLYTSDAADE